MKRLVLTRTIDGVVYRLYKGESLRIHSVEGSEFVYKTDWERSILGVEFFATYALYKRKWGTVLLTWKVAKKKNWPAFRASFIAHRDS